MKIRGKDACVPCWFFKKDFEEVLERELTNQQFVLLADFVQEDLMDKMSDIAMDYLCENKKDIDNLLDTED